MKTQNTGNSILDLLMYYNQNYFKKPTKKLVYQIVPVIGVFFWYLSSVMVNVHWKKTFKSCGLTKSTTSEHYQYAMFFTTLQFATGAATSFVLIVCSNKLENLTSLSTMWKKGAVVGGLFYLGQLSTNTSLTMTSVTLTHMVKTLEPLLALLWAITILKNNISCASIVYICVMLAGVLFTGYKEVSLSLSGVVFALFSNVSLSLRNLVIKLSNRNEILNGLQLFFVSCSFGCLYSLILYSFVKQSSVEKYYKVLSVESIQMGLYFSGQHIMSYLLLHYISITSHALLNCLKRALIIFIAAIVLGDKLPLTQILGVIVTIIGSIFYVLEIRKPVNGKVDDKGNLDMGFAITKNVGYIFSKSYKLTLLLFMTIFFHLTVLGENTYNNDLPLKSRIENVTAIWAFDDSLNIKSLEFITDKLDTSNIYLKILCYNVEKCQRSVKQLKSKSLDVEIVQLKAFELSAGTPVAAWMALHPINKITSLTCFSLYFHKMIYLSALWKYGGLVIDLALDMNTNSNISEFIISTSFQGCISDKSESNILLCNLIPKHKYTEVMIEKVSKLFVKNPKSCAFTSSFLNLKNVTNIVNSGIDYSIPSAERKFGLLVYESTKNLGDEMQSIAVANILPHIYTSIERDSFTNPNETSLTYIGNAWWKDVGILFKDVPKLITVPVGVHISPLAYTKIKSSKALLSAMAPIGARDLTTYDELRKNGIEAIFTGCLTLWLKNPHLFTRHKRGNKTIAVDMHWDYNPIPPKLKNVEYKSHYWGVSGENPQVTNFSQEDRYIMTYEKLMDYAEARLVVTSRIHVALPCVAIGTPVIFLNSDMFWDATDSPSARVVGLLDMFHTVDIYKMDERRIIKFFKTFNWVNPPPNPNPNKVGILKRKARRILERIPELSASLKVFELI